MLGRRDKNKNKESTEEIRLKFIEEKSSQREFSSADELMRNQAELRKLGKGEIEDLENTSGKRGMTTLILRNAIRNADIVCLLIAFIFVFLLGYGATELMRGVSRDELKKSISDIVWMIIYIIISVVSGISALLSSKGTFSLVLKDLIKKFTKRLKKEEVDVWGRTEKPKK